MNPILTGSSSEEDDVSPRENIQKNSKGFSDFCVRRVAQVNLKYLELLCKVGISKNHHYKCYG